MNRADLRELHNITPFANLPSILQIGILSHNRARKLSPTSIADLEVQKIRHSKTVPGGRPLHEYANLYISARNAMLYKVLGLPNSPPPSHLNICIIGVSTQVLDLPGVAITDRNAAASLSLFLPSPSGLEKLEREKIFSRYWTDPDPIVEMDKRESMMAEVLIPDAVNPKFLGAFYVCCDEARLAAAGLGLGIPITVNRYLFFNDSGRSHD
jgi:hypothetical protein